MVLWASILHMNVTPINLQTLIIVLIIFHFESIFLSHKKSIFCSYTLY